MREVFLYSGNDTFKGLRLRNDARFRRMVIIFVYYFSEQAEKGPAFNFSRQFIDEAFSFFQCQVNIGFSIFVILFQTFESLG